MDELTAHPTKAISILAGAIAAVSLLISAIRNDKRIRFSWARQATVVAAICILIWCAGTFLLLIRSPWIAPSHADGVMLLKTAIGSIGAGIIITLFISRSYAWRSPDKTDGPSGP